jgi:hypothetical protein
VRKVTRFLFYIISFFATLPATFEKSGVKTNEEKWRQNK